MEAFSSQLEINFPAYFVDALAQWEQFEQQGLVQVQGNRLCITEQGRLVSRALVMPFDVTSKSQINRYSRII